ncbi:MAG: hypothetical protein WA936_07965 [Erythrobacter sp.]|uniref:hypothetical protein n=1 Tax=Erythrobacter sp. TaxID=1042 RepID=UPI003C775066
MIAALLLALQAAPAEPVPEIVIIGNLRTLEASVGQDAQGRWHCSLDRSTGRASLDDRFCRAVTKCVRKGAKSDDAIEACVRESRSRLVRSVERAMRKGTR